MIKRPLEHDPDKQLCEIHFDEEGWPIDPEGCQAETTTSAMHDWPNFSSDDEAPPPERKRTHTAPRVATGPAPSTLTPKQRQVIAKGLEMSTKEALSGRVGLKKAAEQSTKTEGASATNGDISMGRVRIGCYSEKSYIQVHVAEECKWRSVCYCDAKKSEQHAAIMRVIFQQALELDYDEDTMRRERDRLVEEM